jgi:iron complex transport system permease protein
VALLILALAMLMSTLVGAASLGWSRVLQEIYAQITGGVSPLSSREAAILWYLRVPRVVLAGLVGAALAISGAAFQGVFRNPLADPFLLGAAAGAGLGATIVVVSAPSVTAWGISPLPLAAFAGALGGVGLSWAISQSASGTA